MSTRRSRLSVRSENAGWFMRGVTWAWIATASVTGVVGLVVVYRQPERVAVVEFSAIYDAVGLGDRVMITLFLALPLAFAVFVGSVVVLRRGADRGALVLAAGLVALYYYVSGSATGLETPVLRYGLPSIAVVLVSAFLVGFPTGTFWPRWSIGVPIVAVAFMLVEPRLAFEMRALVGSPESRLLRPSAAGAMFFSIVLGLSVVSQITRDRWHSDEAERHQARWVSVGLVCMLAPPAMLLLLDFLQVSTPGIVGAAVAVTALGSYVLPITLSIAVFRYHLFDIDRLISRTVSYGLVAGAIGAVYALPVVLFPSVVASEGDLFVAGATLLAAAIFNPLRRRIQRWTDARFDRSRYDAEREIENLERRLRTELRPGGVVEEVSGVIHRTLAPAELVVWIRPRSQSRL